MLKPRTHILKNKKVALRITRHMRVRGKVSGIANKPRLAVFRSAKYIYAQIIDDQKGHTLAAASDLVLDPKAKKLTKVARSMEVGKTLADLAIKAKVKKVAFDRGGYRYHGRVKALANGAREGGLEF